MLLWLENSKEHVIITKEFNNLIQHNFILLFIQKLQIKFPPCQRLNSCEFI